jgi:hypothetical protein
MDTLAQNDQQEQITPQVVDVTGLSPAAVRVVESLVHALRSNSAGTTSLNAAESGREMLAYRDRVKRTLGGSFRELAHAGHRY